MIKGVLLWEWNLSREMLNLSFCNYYRRLDKNINIDIPLENYLRYVILLDKQINQVYGLPRISRQDLKRFKGKDSYIKRRSDFMALVLALRNYNDAKCDRKEGLLGINLLPVDYRVKSYPKIYDQYRQLFLFLSHIAKRSDHSMREWSDLLNDTWYQVHLLHDIVVEDGFDTGSLISTIDRMMDRLGNLEPSWKDQLTSAGKEYLGTTISKLGKLKGWLRTDLEKYGTLKVSGRECNYVYSTNDSFKGERRDRSHHFEKGFDRGWNPEDDWEERFRHHMMSEWDKIRAEQQAWAEERREERRGKKEGYDKRSRTHASKIFISLCNAYMILIIFVLALSIPIMLILFW